MFGIISGLASLAVSVVSKAVSVVGSAIKSVATTLIEMGVEKLRLVADVIEAVGRLLGVIKSEDNIDDIGDRAMRSDKKPEDFDSHIEYVDYLKENIQPNDLSTLSPAERLARKAVGASILSKAIEEKTSLEIPLEFWKLSTEKGLTPTEVFEFVNNFKKLGISPNEFVKFLKQELKEQDEEKVENALIKAYKELEPEADEYDIEKKVINLPYKKEQ